MISIVPFQDSDQADFYKINEEWISSMFTMEDIDKEILLNPQERILDPGGYIWFARHENMGNIGTCALRKTGNSEFELTKMGVLKQARGLGAGETLLQHVIDFVREQKFKLCYLLTNAHCKAAIHLYLKNGFVHDPQIKEKFGPEYQRCDIAMRLNLN